VGVCLAGRGPLTTTPLDPAFVRRTDTGVTIELRVQPRARRSALEVTAEGALKAAVTAPPEDGKANAAVVALLADTWRLPKSAFEVARGATARQKTLGVAGEPALLADRIAEWVRKHG
jgi:uncharacterized protein (TIGR00251 family)